ncbi:hypothetical protein TSAR_009556 [Trichomalopsis sarcophagae]|uniref:Uncharacterized protein n=1 Tax=Trichomalopsis sarcophagae TaxID=543379 RepID=A0A232EK09_9HYME|nr:hypothetical protein TSAR_009556 [Trichomalopsis sarcophagae]
MAELLSTRQALVAVIKAFMSTMASTPTDIWTMGLVRRLLQSRYEHQKLLVQDHLNALRALRPLHEKSSVGLRGLLDTVSRHRDQWLTLQRPDETWDDWFISIAT